MGPYQAWNLRIREDPAYEAWVRVMSPGSGGLKLYRHLLALQHQHPKLVIATGLAPNADVEMRC